LSPISSFATFDVDKLLMMVELYPILRVSEVVVCHQLQNNVRNVRDDPNFAKLKGVSNFCVKLVNYI